MRGHIARKGSRFYPVVDIGPHPETGRRQQKWHAGHDDRDAADRALREILRELDECRYVEPSKLTLGAFLVEDWLPSLGRERRQGTVSLYETTVRAYVLPHLGATRLQALTPKGLNDAYDELLLRGGKRKGPLAPKTVLNVHTTLRTALEDAVRWGKLSRNPAELAAPPRPREREMHTWTGPELRTFLEHVREDRLYAAWILAATTGMRRGEVLGLRWRDVDLKTGRASIMRALVVVDGAAIFSDPKTAKSRRSVPLAPEAVAALKAHHKAQAEERFAAGPGYSDGDLTFAHEDARASPPTGSAAGSTACPSTPAARRSGSMTFGTRSRPWPCRRACTRRWFPRSSGTRASGSRSTRTRTRSPPSRSRPPRPWPA